MNYKSLTAKTVSLIIIACIILLHGCAKEKDINLIIESCDEISSVFSFFHELESDGNYVISSFEENGCYVFELSTGTSVGLPDDCVEIFEIDDTQINIVFDKGITLSIPYGHLIQLKYSHNPSGYTPLSGALELVSSIDGTLELTIHHISDSTKNLIQRFDHPAGTHTYPVLGLFFDHENIIEANFIANSDTLERIKIIESTSKRPDYLPSIKVTKKDMDKMEPGMNMISYRAKWDPTVAFIIDNDGLVRWLLDYQGHPELTSMNFDVGIERLQNGNLYFGNWPSQNLYEIDMVGNIVDQWSIPGFEFHHNIQEKENGNFLVTANKFGSQHEGGLWAIEDFILEVDRHNNSILHVLDLKESLDEHRRTMGTDEFSGVIDWIHVNAVIEDPSDNTIIISSRFQGIIKLDYDNNVKWILSPQKGWTENRRGQALDQYFLQPLDASGNAINDPDILMGYENHEEFEWPWFQHAPFLHENGNLFVFDNGDRRNFAVDQRYSRAVEYKIDEENKTVQQVWTYGKERESGMYSRIVSDVDHLPTFNNILVSPGSRVLNSGGEYGGKIIEVHYDTKEVVFECELNAQGIVFHRVERMSLYPE
ncbi:MAG: hypothetical protein HKN09_07850 [Saprospiraceae bacterium]|nr:hypothetical protein [Saprospiraceae bacterium]